MSTSDEELEREIAAALGDESLEEMTREPDEAKPSKPGDMDQAALDREIDAALGGQSIGDIAAGMSATSGEPREGAFTEGVVAGIAGDDVFIEFGPRTQGVVPLAQFATPPEIGQKQRVFVASFDRKENLYSCGIRRQVQTAEWDGLEIGSILDGLVRAANAGGLEVQVGVLSAFLPASHIDLERIDDMEACIGRTFQVEVIEIDPEKKRLVVSRRGILNRERDALRKESVSVLNPGTVTSGAVTRIEKFGAFVELGGVEGLLHVSELAHKRVENPEDYVKVGDRVTVKILSVEEDGRRISLSMKALQEDPWRAYTAAHPAGSVVPGKVTRLASYGAFIEVADGVEGLAHVSQLAPHGVSTAREVVKIGEELSVRVVAVEPERRRIGLSLLTERGDRLTDDVADDDTIRRLTGASDEAEPTLGDLLKKALEGDQ